MTKNKTREDDYTQTKGEFAVANDKKGKIEKYNCIRDSRQEKSLTKNEKYSSNSRDGVKKAKFINTAR